MLEFLKEYKDVFAWSHEDMKRLDPKFYQHKINLSTDAKPIQQRLFRMSQNYAAHVKEEIYKLLREASVSNEPKLCASYNHQIGGNLSMSLWMLQILQYAMH